MWFWLRLYAALMCASGFGIVLLDGWLYARGAITRRINARCCLLIGLFWPVFAFVGGYLLWRIHQRRH